MVAVVSGNGLGLFNTSLTQLGTTFGGQTGIGQSAEAQIVNIATGNLLLQDQDESLQVRGLNTTFLRTYNSQGQVAGVGQDGWITGYERHVALSSGTFNTAGSTMTLYTGDGQAVVFTYASSNHYTTTAGDGANDTLVWANASRTWTYTEGSTQRQETYADHADATLQGRLTQIKDVATSATYNVLYDSNNRVSEVRSVDDVNGATSDAILFGYNGTTTQLTSVTTREGGVVKSQLTYGYDSVGRLSWVQTDLTPTISTDNTWDGTTAANNDGLRFRTTYTYVTGTTSDLRIASVSGSDGVAVSYTYESDGAGGYRVKTVTQGSAADGSAQTVTFTYNSGSTDVTDASGRTWTYQYDASKRLTAVLEPAVSGLRTITNYNYDAASHVTQIQTARGGTVLSETDNAYDGSENLTSQWTRVNGSNASAAVVQRTYSSTNQVLTEARYSALDTDSTGTGVVLSSGGLTTTYIYDTTNPEQLLFALDAAGGVTQYTYATSGNGVGQVASVRHFSAAAYTGAKTKTGLTTWTNTNVATSTLTTYAYDAKGRLQQAVDYATVDSSGNGVLDAATGITSYTYNAQGLLLQKIDVHGATRTVGGSAPPTSASTDYIYDGMGRLLSVLSRDTATSTTAPDPILDPTGYAAWDAATVLSAYTYTDSANQIKVTLDTGMVRTEARNAAGQLVSVSEVGAVEGTQVTRTMQNFYDATGLLRATQDATGARSYLFYDATGQITAQVDATGAVTAYVRDGMGRITDTIEYPTRVDTSGWLVGTTVVPDTIDAIRPGWSTDFSALPVNGLDTSQVDNPASANVIQLSGGQLVFQVSANATDISPSISGTASHALSDDTTYRGEVTTGATQNNTYLLFSVENSMTGDFRRAAVFFRNGKLYETTYSNGVWTDTLLGTTQANTTYVVEAQTRDGAVAYAVYVKGQDPSTGWAFSVNAEAKDWGATKLMVYGYGGAGQVGDPLYLDNLSESVLGVRHNTTTYDGLGRVATQTDAAGLITAYAYDGLSNLISTTVSKPGDGTVTPRVTRFFYDNANRQVATLDAAGYLTESIYDLDGRLIETIRYATLTNSTYWTSGTLTQLRPAANANDAVTRYFYNGRSQLIGELDAVGGTATVGTGYLTEYVYDEQANQRAVKAYGTLLTGLAGTETFATLQATAVAGAGGVQLTQRSFNALGQLTTELNAEGTVTHYSYDDAGRLVRTEANQGQSDVRENFERYDVFGNLIGTLTGEQAAQATATLSDGKLLNDPTLTDAQLDAAYSTYGTTYAYDLVGRRIESTDAQGNKTWYFYDADGRQTFLVRGVTDGNGLQNAQGEVTETRYNTFGQVTDQLVYTGRITVPVPGSRASVLGAIDTLMFVAATDTHRQMGYDQRGLLTQTTDAEGAVSNYSYTAFGQLLQEQRAVGTSAAETVQHAYDQRGLETSRTDAVGLSIARTVSQTFDAFGRVATQTDALGTVTTFTYDRLGRQLSHSATFEGRLEAWSATYDAYSRTLSQTDALGNTTTYVYSDTNRSVTVTTAEGVVMSTVHNRFGQTVQVTTAAGTSSSSYDRNGELVQSTDATGAVSTNTYDVRGLLTETTDATGRKVDYIYDAVGRVLRRIQDPAGLALTTSWSYDGQGRAVQSIDPTGLITNTTYDREGRVLSMAVDPDGLNLRTTYTWNAAGRELSVTAGAGSSNPQTTAYAYDALGRRISETVDPGTGKLNLTTSYTYDASDNVVARTDALGNTAYFAYDAANRLRFTADAAGDVTQTLYDADGRVAMTRRYAKAATGISAPRTVAQMQALVASQTLANDAVDPVAYQVYDTDGRLRFTIDGLGDVSAALYDSASRTIGTRSYATAITLDSTLKNKLLLGTALVADITAKLTPSDIRDAQAYQVLDAAGRVRFAIDGLGDVTEMRYDAAGRAVEQLAYVTPLTLSGADLTALKAGTLTVATVAGRVAGQEATAHASYQVFDAAGRVRYTVTHSQVDASVVGTVTENRYDAAGRMIVQIQYASTIAFDPAQTEAALTSLLTAAGGDLAINQHITRIVYDAAGRQRFTVSDAGTVTEQRFDAEGRVVMTRNYGTAVPVTGYTEATLEAAVSGFTDTRQVSYTYDAAGRLISTTDALNQTESYGYDALGNRTSLTNKLGNTWTYVYDAAGRQTEIHTPQVAVLRFDASGNLLAPSTESVVTKIGYDGLGNAVSRTEAYGTAEARTTTYGYDARGNQVHTVFPDAWAVNSSGVLVATGVTPDIQITYNALDQAVVQKDVLGNYSYKIYDQQGRLAYDIDANGYVTGYSYDAQGEVVQLTRYAAKLNIAGISGWSAGSAIRLDQIQTAGVLVTGTADRTITTTFDVAGNKRTVTQTAVSYTKADGTTATGSPTTQFTLDAFGQVVKESVLLEGTPGQPDAQWADTYHYYDDLGRKVMDVDADGYVTTYAYTAQGEIAQQIQYARALSAATLAGLSTATPPALPAPGDATIGYDRRTVCTYDALGRKATETALAQHYERADGSSGVRDVQTTYSYDAVDDVIATAADGVLTQTSFDALGRTVAVEEAQRAVLASNFDSQLTGSNAVDLGSSALYVQSSPYTTIAYDAFGNTVQVRRYAKGWVQGQGAAVTSASDQVQTTQYDRQGRDVIERSAEGTSVYRHYDAADNLKEVDYRLDGNDGRWANVRSLATYDAANQQILTQVFRDQYLNTTSLGTVTDQVVQVRYNAFGEITSKGDVTSLTATLAAQYTYDAAGRMHTSNAQDGAVSTYGYNLAGYQLTESHQVTTAAGVDTTVVTTQATDRLGRVLRVILPSYNSTLTTTTTVSQSLDRWGNVIETIDPRGYVTDTTYNQFSQKVSETQPLVKVVDAAGVETWQRPEVHWFYDALGRLQGTRDANGNISKLVYDATGRQIQSIDALGNATLQAYDAFGQQLLTQDPLGYITFQTLDRLGRVTGQGDYLPSGTTRTRTVLQAYVLDQNGDRIQTINALAGTLKDDFDSRNLLIRSQTAMGVIESFAYDASGHKTLDSTALKSSASTDRDGDLVYLGEQSWKTDFFGRMTDHNDLSGRDWNYVYDANSGELVQETTSDATAALNRSTIYYANGQVRKTTESQTGGVTSYYEYDAAGNRTVEETTSTDSQGMALHVRTTTTYDSHNRIAHTVQDDLATGVRVFDLTYDYDAQGNRRRVVATSGYGPDTTPISTDDLPPEVVATPDNRTLRSGVPVNFSVRASDVFRDPELDVLTLSVKQVVGGVVQNLPSWLTCMLDATTGELVFTATSGSTAALGQTLTIQLAATDTSSNTATTTFTLAVVANSTPTSSGTGTTTFLAKTDEPWALEVNAGDYFSDADVGDTLTLTVAGISPAAPWLTVDTSNPAVVRLSGTPGTVNNGTYTITARATDAQGASVTRTLTITVAPNHAPVVVAPIAAQDATLNTTFDLLRDLPQVFTDADGDALAVTATLADGSALPSWLNFQYLNDQAVPQLQLSGQVPGSETPGTVYQVRLTATDSDGAVVSTTVAITIQPNRAPVVVGTLPLQSGRVNTAFALDVPIASLFADPDGDLLTVSLLSSSTTAWMHLAVDADTGVLHLTGTPNVAGDYTLRIVATDPDGLCTPYDLSLHIRDNTAPTFSGHQPTTTLYTSQAFSFTIPKPIDADGDLDGYTANLIDPTWEQDSQTWFDNPSPLPAWLFFDEATGTFSGTAPASTVALHVQIHLPGLGNKYDFDLNVSSGTRPTNHAPTATGTLPSMVRATPNQAFSYTIPDDAFADADYDAPVFSAPTGTLPPGITFNTATHTFSGTPTSSGSWTVTLHVTDGRGGSVSPNPTLTIEVSANHAPTVAHATSDQSTTQGQAWSATLASNIFTDTDGDALSWIVTGLPPGVVYTPSTRSFSGAPLAAGSYNVSITATDSSGASVSDVFVLTVAAPANHAPIVAASIPDQPATLNQAFSYTFPSNTFTDADGDALSYTTSSLPAGIAFNASTRTFSGTPTATGATSITVTATDIHGASVSDVFVLTVSASSNHAPTVATPIPDASATIGVAWSYTFPSNTFADADGDALSYTTSSLPGGIAFNASTRTFSGTPTATGATSITVTATDTHGASVSDVFVLTVNTPANQPPVVAHPLVDQIAHNGVAFSYTFAANTFTDPNGDTLSYSSPAPTGMPVWMSFNATTRTFSGIFGLPGNHSYTITVTANDGHGGTISDSFVLTYAGGSGGGGGMMMQMFTMAEDSETTEDTTTVVQQTAYYAYDADNRVSVSNGVLQDGQIVVDATEGSDGYVQIYDAAGHMVGQERWMGDDGSLQLTQSVVDLRGETIAVYAARPLDEQGASLDTRQVFDAAGRLLQTLNYFTAGEILNIVDGEGNLVPVRVGGMLSSAQVYTYDADGRILTQTQLQRPIATTTRNLFGGGTKTFPSWLLNVQSPAGDGNGQDQYNDLAVLDTRSEVNYVGTGLGYDAAGRLLGYTYYSAPTIYKSTSSTQTFLSSYIGRDSWLEASVSGTSTDHNDKPTTSTIAYDAANRETSITEHTNYDSLDDRLRVFTSDGDGQILRRRDGTIHDSAFVPTSDDDDPNVALQALHHMVYVNGQQVASLDESGSDTSIDALSRVTGFANTNTGSSDVVVQDGEDLQSIAQRIYGNAGLWYVLAAANALDSNATLVAGTTLKAPQVTTNSNDASTFKPYNPGDITGPNAPTLPHIPPPPGSGCGAIGMVIMIVVAVVAAVLTAGAILALVPEGLGAASAGLAALAGAVGGAVGSLAGEAVGSVLGVAHFSWSGVAAGAITGAITGGMAGEWGSVGQALADSHYLEAAGLALADAGANYAGQKLAGIDIAFSWKSIAASAVGNVVGSYVANNLPVSMNTFTRSFTSGMVGGVVSQATRKTLGMKGPTDYLTIVADAFGNALGNAINSGGQSPAQGNAFAMGPAPLNDFETANGMFPFGASDQYDADASSSGGQSEVLPGGTANTSSAPLADYFFANGQPDFNEYFMAPDGETPAGQSRMVTGYDLSGNVDVTRQAYADDPAAGAGDQMGYLGQWLSYARAMEFDHLATDMGTIDQAQQLYNSAMGDPSTFQGLYTQSQVDMAIAATNDMIAANGWTYGSNPDDSQPVGNAEPLVVTGSNTTGTSTIPVDRDGIAIVSGTPNVQPSMLQTADTAIADLNNIVNDELVEQGALADKRGDTLGFVLGGLKYSFYNTFMPHSVEEGAIGLVGGAVIGKGVGIVAKAAVAWRPVLGRPLGELATSSMARLKGWIHPPVTPSIEVANTPPPGNWTPVNESMSDSARTYQTQITGQTNQAYVVDGVKFDGATDTSYLDAKGPNYSNFVDSDGEFYPWWKGGNSFINQATRQLDVAGEYPIEWHFAEQDAANATQSLFNQNGISGIRIIHTPVVPPPF